MISEALYSHGKNNWGTPQAFFDKLNEEFNFTIDLAAEEWSAKCQRFYTIEDNALRQDWGKERGFLNPPYGRKTGHWLRKAYESSLNGATIVLLLPARTDTKWFHRWILGKAEIRFVKGRLVFELPGKESVGAPFPSMVVIYRPQKG
jgi:site-specific DNA-methyltransferase (adenine-specific)